MNFKNLIKATIIADSISENGIRMTTMEIEYPRFILAELNTHRMLSKNSASSRAIPVASMLEHIRHNTAGPVYWGKNQSGMQAKEQVGSANRSMAEYLWIKARDSAINYALQLTDLGLHKQLTNRITEPWMLMKTVISGTEWANFFWLRNHPDAQPEIAELAAKMYAAYSTSTPELLYSGEWHVPYVNTYRNTIEDQRTYHDANGDKIAAHDAKIISASCCAQVSYRKNDDSFDKALKIYKQLIESQPAHASPVEHQATPVDSRVFSIYEPERWKAFGISHIDAELQPWSGNLRGWVQFRKLIPNEAKW